MNVFVSQQVGKLDQKVLIHNAKEPEQHQVDFCPIKKPHHAHVKSTFMGTEKRFFPLIKTEGGATLQLQYEAGT